jgi:hypothetical protein
MKLLAVALLVIASVARADGVEDQLARDFVSDPKARDVALALYRDLGDIVGAGSDEQMEGGYRGVIHLVPQLPIGKYRDHVVWIAGSMRAIDAFFAQLFAGQPAPNYRWKPLAFRVVRSPGKRTPSAYATSWTVTYNVNGSLLTSQAAVQETLFHELFHDNDEAHGDWSATALAADFDAIVRKCGTRVACLDPYAPNVTKVRGGTYYAFQPNNGNGVHEYAAELAVRYFDEQSAMLRTGKLTRKAFKCGPAENARAWQALITEFFAGRDLVPAC